MLLHCTGLLVYRGRMSDLGPKGFGVCIPGRVLAEVINLSIFLLLCEALCTKKKRGG